MLGYDYEIIYKKGKENVVLDALSCLYEDAMPLLSLLVPIPEWLEVSHQQWFNDPPIAQLIHTLEETPHTTTKYTYKDDTLRYKACLVLISASVLK